jgi:hypothetical protein
VGFESLFVLTTNVILRRSPQQPGLCSIVERYPLMTLMLYSLADSLLHANVARYPGIRAMDSATNRCIIVVRPNRLLLKLEATPAIFKCTLTTQKIKNTHTHTHTHTSNNMNKKKNTDTSKRFNIIQHHQQQQQQ